MNIRIYLNMINAIIVRLLWWLLYIQSSYLVAKSVFFTVYLGRMEQIEGNIYTNYSDPRINDLLSSANSGARDYTLHFNQNEEFFLKSEKDFLVPKFPIHHDVTKKRPEDAYIELLESFLSSVIPLFPQVFQGMSYFFDPAEILRPCFFQLFRIGEKQYLNLMRLDLLFKTHEGEIIEYGDNDRTAAYRTRSLFLENDLIPLDGVLQENGKIAGFKVYQTVSQTWIGETGRGYFVQGIWMDNELTKFFSKLFLPPEKRLYPYYPFMCKFRTITFSLVDLSPEGRKKYLPYLVRAVQFLEPLMDEIQSALRQTKFSTDLPVFTKLKQHVPEKWNRSWDNLQMDRYLNDREMKEFKLEILP